MDIRAVCVAALLLIGFWPTRAVAQDDVVYDDDVKLASFECVVYPSTAQTAMVQGDVVIAVTMNDDGTVKSAVPLSGAKLLIPDAVASVKKWRFVPNRQRRAVVVCEFRIEGACADGLRNLSRILHQNVVSVIGCIPRVNTAAPR